MPVRIRSKRPGFRRCGVAHPDEWVDHPEDRFTPEQLAQLQAEPMLQVVVTETQPTEARQPDDSASDADPTPGGTGSSGANAEPDKGSTSEDAQKPGKSKKSEAKE